MNTEVTKLLSELAAKLGTTVEYLWPLLVRKELINAWMGAIAGGLMALAAGAASVKAFRKMKQKLVKTSHDSFGGNHNDEVLLLGSSAWLLLVIAGIGIFVVLGSVSDICVPEASALRAITNLR